MKREEIRNKIREIGIIPSVRVKSAELALFAVEYIAAGGIPIAEIAATIPGCTQVIADLRQRFPQVITGAEVLSLEDAERQFEAGAQFLTAPAFQPEIADFCRQHDCVFIPGALTPTEILAAHRSGADYVKVFPSAKSAEKNTSAPSRPLCRRSRSSPPVASPRALPRPTSMPAPPPLAWVRTSSRARPCASARVPGFASSPCASASSSNRPAARNTKPD